ncbi:glycoside hydrolase family 3 N-terminal domain-containing protein [Lentisphaerota bacterium WC36G]|nr:glycoside hydrolase family 3 C-terminal domain-containing protein [Lentisphaerae bacterium WC36]
MGILSKKTAFVASILACLIANLEAKAIPKPWLNKNLPEEKRVELLLKEMTLEEKIYQLNQLVKGSDKNENNVNMWYKSQKINPLNGSYLYASQSPEMRNAIQKMAIEQTRLGIPIIFGYDVIHGLKVISPMPLGQGASFNLDLVEQASATAAKESQRMGLDWTFAPMVDIAFDPRWGRIAEGYGEDPYITSRFGEATVYGLQGRNPLKDLPRPDKIGACLKHFVAYGASEGGRDYNFTAVTRNDLFNFYLPPFKAGVDAGAVTLMSAFNDLSGVPTSANYFTETEILRNQWGFDGFIVSDWGSVVQLINQGYAKNRSQAAKLALEAGTDMDMVDKVYIENLEKLVQNNELDVKVIDESVKRILRIKFRLGLFDNPYVKIYPKEERYYAKEDLAIARKLAEESFVLLENNNNTLPLKAKNIKTIALIGPAADDAVTMLGPWRGHAEPNKTPTLKDALEKQFADNIKIIYQKGCDYKKRNLNLDTEKLAEADVTIVCIGENGKPSSENNSRSGIYLEGDQNKLIQEVKKHSKKVVSLLFTARPLELETIKKNSDALMVTWYPGSEGANAIINVLFGKVAPSGKLTATFPRYVGQVPIHYNRRNCARTGGQGNYRDASTKPLYSFGTGKSYTTFKYSNLKLSNNEVSKGEKITATVTVTNTGNIDAKEAVIWYITDPYATITRPRKEVKFFEKKLVKAQESITYSFEIDPIKSFGYYDDNGKLILDKGEIILQVGNQKAKIMCK